MAKWWLIVIGCLITFSVHATEVVNIAVATNFKPTLQRIVADYQKSNPNTDIKISSASSGVLAQQIALGAPFDLFLSADSERAIWLEQQQKIIPNSRVSYAVGQLVVWSANHRLTDLSQLTNLSQLSNAKVIAIANPKVAPYGVAAQQALAQLAPNLTARIAKANNVAQVMTYVEQGYADIGFVALSHLLLANKAHYLEVPAQFYQPLVQQMVLLKPTNQAPSSASVALYKFLQTERAQKIMVESGYALPQDKVEQP